MNEKIEAKCGDCGVRLAVPRAVAGKKIRCPSCQGVVDVPSDTGTSSGKAPVRKPPAAEQPQKKKPQRGSGAATPADRVPRIAPSKKNRTKPPPEDYDSYSDASPATSADPYTDSYSYAPGALPPRQKKKNAAASATAGSAAAYNPYTSSSDSLESRVSTVGSDDELTGVDIAICILCANVGCIIGIYRLCTGKPSSGLKMLLLAIIVQVFLAGLGLSLGGVPRGFGR